MNPPLRETTLYTKTLGCLLGGLIGDAIGTPTEGLDYATIEERFGWVKDFQGEGTDDTVMKNLLAEALIRTDGYATLDDWAAVWLEDWEAIFGPKVGKFFISVLHTAQKLRRHAVPRMAALGNMPSSSSAMCISPVGIVNACHPLRAGLQAYNLASLIHGHDVGFCQDGAAAMAAATAEAFKPQATVGSIINEAYAAIIELSGAEMRGRIRALLDLAREKGEYKAFRAALYGDADRFFCQITCDSRETVPLTLALFELAEGDFARCVTYAANLGRDADTIASMVGAMAGALHGVDGIPADWRQRALDNATTDQHELAMRLCRTALIKHETERAAGELLEAIASQPLAKE
jgi:ADP-ribosylglycohydrolase